MEQQGRMSVEICEPGFRCLGCPMIGQPDDVRVAIPRAIEKIYTQHDKSQWPNPAMAAIVTPSALYESGIARPSREQLTKVRIAVQRIATKGECSSYMLDENHLPIKRTRE